MIRQQITIDDHGLFARLERYPQILDEEAHTTVWAILLYLKPLVRRFTPVGAFRYLRSSVYTRVTGHTVNLLGRIATPALYGESVEYGTRPHWAPIAPLKHWAARVLGDESAAYAVRWKIKREGTKGVHMFQKAFNEAQGFIRREKAALATRIVRRLEGR